MNRFVHRPRRWPVTALLLCVAAGFAWGQDVWPAKAGATPTLTLNVDYAAGSGEVSISVSLAGQGTQPTIAVFAVSYDAARLTFLPSSVVTGAAALAAGKHAFANVDENGDVRFVVWGLNTDAIGDGDLVMVSFQVISADDQGPFFFSGADPSMSNALGISIATQIVYFASPHVSVSQGETDGIHVEWTAVDAATGYRVFRAETNDPNAAEPITDWLDSTVLSYLDTSAEPVQAANAGCPGTIQLKPIYYYWVNARLDAAHEGSLSAPGAAGYVAAAKASTGAAVLPLPFRVGDAMGDIALFGVVAAVLAGVARSRSRGRA